MWKINLILSFVLNITLVFANINPLVFINHNKFVGDLCTPANGSEGKCVKAKECTTIKNPRGIIRCEFELNELIVCCPVIEEIKSSNDEETTIMNQDDTTYPPPPKDLVISRFNDILCENQQIKKKFTSNIVGGKEASVAEFPYQVALGYKTAIEGTFDFNCGGSLILNDIVVTAAHCVHLKDVQPVMVRLGRTSLVEDPYDHGPIVDVAIKKIIIHELSRRSDRVNDIAIIQLDQKVEFTDYVKTICISKDNDAFNKNLTVTGFGIVNPNTKQKSTWLMKGTVQEEFFDDCKNSYKIVSKTIFNTHICANGKFGSDACQGDSGGPLILEKKGQDRLYGVTSHGNGCVSGLPALYTRVDQFLDWIEKNINILDQSENLQ